MNSIDISTLENLKMFCLTFLEKTSQGGVILLSGDLGAGKTTLVRLFLEGLYQKNNLPSEKVTSPTFVIHQSYFRLEHFDLYRLENAGPAELLEVGYYESLEKAKNEKGYVFVEWPEKVKSIELLQAAHHFKLQFDGKKRTLTVTLISRRAEKSEL